MAAATHTSGARPSRSAVASGWALLALIAAALPAFWPRYLGVPPRAIDAHTHVHAAVMTVWCAMLVAQPFLASGAGRWWHRLIGRASFAVAPAVVMSSVALAHQRFAAMGAETLIVEGPNLYLPLSAALLFAVAWTCGMAWRRTPAIHRRFMVCTALPLIDPIVGRLMGIYLPPFSHPVLYQAVTFGGGDLVFAWLAWHDRGAPGGWAWRWMLALAALVHVGWFTLAWTGSWLQFVRWFVTLPLP